MKKLWAILLLCHAVTALAQTPVLQLTPRGFEPVTYTLPRIEGGKFVDLARAWVTEQKRRHGQFDLSNVGAGTLTISGIEKNAFFYRSRGETFQHKAKLVMKVDFTPTGYTLTLTVPEIYAEGDTPTQYTLPDYFDSNGNIKEGYDGLKTSIEATANDIALNYYNFIINYK
ncbi:hypothetical protein ACLI09_06295 [Flavobacterium sp. RHBU_24]|uniref:hypothetical protein n=1 Tax=Flavobacterium sp. RHBU_24 TaxID=3391185 RepID=UPI003984C653